MEADEVIQEIEEEEEEEIGEALEEVAAEEEVAEEGEDEEEEEEENPPLAEGAEEIAPAKKKRDRKDPETLRREPGKSLLPFSKVQKIIKADKEIPIIARDAVFVVSLATEVFIAELAQAAQRVAEREKRTTVQYKDVATVVRKADEFMFLEDLMPWLSSEPEKKRGKPVPPGPGTKSGGPTLLDQFVVAKDKNDGDDGMDVVMNEDGTMYAVGETND